MLLEGRCRYLATLVACSCLAISGCAGPPRASTPERHDAAAPVTPVLLYRQTSRADEFARLVVPVQLNGEGPFFFLLDTGAARSALTQAAVERLGLSVDQAQQVVVRGVSGRSRVPTVAVSSFRVGDIEFPEQRLPVIRAQILDGLDGILSLDRLRGLHLTADFANAEVRIMNVGSDESPSNALRMRYGWISTGLIVVEARIGDHRVPAIIDTGGAHTLGNVALLNELIADAGGVLHGVIMSRVADATDTVLETWDSRVETLEIGAVAIDDLRVSFGRFPVFKYWNLDERPALLIGMDVLSRTKSLSVDYGRREMALAARDSTD
jgi:predicted aspartyl protease